MKKISLNNLTLNEINTLSGEEKKRVTGGADHYEYVCFYCGGPKPICVSIRVGIDPEPC